MDISEHPHSLDERKALLPTLPDPEGLLNLAEAVNFSGLSQATKCPRRHSKLLIFYYFFCKTDFFIIQLGLSIAEAIFLFFVSFLNMLLGLQEYDANELYKFWCFCIIMPH